MRPPQSSAGYTLIEALASLTLLGLVSLLIVAGLQTARLRLSRLGQGEAQRNVATAQMMLRSRIERALPETTLETTAAQIDFDGKSHEVSFVAPPPLAHGPDAPYHYRLYLAGNGDLRLDGSSDLSLDPTKSASEMVLLRDVADLDLDYFGAAVGGEPAGWSDHWQQEATLPQLVRVRVAFGGQERRQWPILMVRPAATIDSACVVDPRTGACQGRS